MDGIDKRAATYRDLVAALAGEFKTGELITILDTLVAGSESDLAGPVGALAEAVQDVIDMP